jgi:type IV pilus assembly protein PilY1
LTVGLVAAGVSGLLSFPAQAQQEPASVVFLVDNHESMQDYPQYLPEAFTPGYYPSPTNPARGDLGGEGSAGLAINTGCSDPALVSAMSWFDKNSTDTAMNGAIPYDSDSDLKSPFFDPNRFYFSRGRRLAWNVKEGPFAINGNDFEGPLNSYGDTLTACYGSVGWNTTDYPYGGATGNSPLMNECMSCLASKGWWRGPIVTSNTRTGQAGPNKELDEAPLPPEAFRKWVLSGRVLNVRPPKFVAARKALKEVIRTAPHTRMGVATFGEDHGWFDPALMLEPLRPSCDDSFPQINEAGLNRARLTQAVNEVNFRNNERSIGEALFSLGGYFSSQKADYRWTMWFQQPINPGWGWPGGLNGGTTDSPYTAQPGNTWGFGSNEWLKTPFMDTSTGKYYPGQPWEDTSPGGRRSVCSESQASAVIVVTGGTPRYDNTVPITKMMDILEANGARHPDGSLLMFDPSNPDTNPNVGGVNYCDLVGSTKAACDYTDYNWPTGHGVGNKNFMDDVAFFLANTDLRGDMPGKQTVRTFVVGYGDSSPLLKSIALAGKGSFFRADQAGSLRDLLLFSVGQSHANSCSAP